MLCTCRYWSKRPVKKWLKPADVSMSVWVTWVETYHKVFGSKKDNYYLVWNKLTFGYVAWHLSCVIFSSVWRIGAPFLLPGALPCSAITFHVCTIYRYILFYSVLFCSILWQNILWVYHYAFFCGYLEQNVLHHKYHIRPTLNYVWLPTFLLQLSYIIVVSILSSTLPTKCVWLPVPIATISMMYFFWSAIQCKMYVPPIH